MSCVRACVRPGCCFRNICGMHWWILHQTFISSASWDEDELIVLRSKSQKIKVTGYAKNTILWFTSLNDISGSAVDLKLKLWLLPKLR